ncbi:glycosyltransferase family 2 protein [Spongiivirga sp. MCCC 1A20706]|uniref:glycosyltransferase family 2 protein n=1 Tax=Spongiivirga sp. MCCC 1A20706 TaxID=3160963 RepID=UPI00397739E7
MKIAVVILNWNGKALLEKFLPSVVTHSRNATIYLADNASTDDSVAYVKSNYPEVAIIQNQENGGYAKGYNDALQYVKEDVVCLLNSDVQVTSNWLVPVVKRFQSDETVAIIQPKILDYKNKTRFEYAGASGGFIDKYGYPFCRGRVFHTLEEDVDQYNDATTIFWASGACFFIKKQVFQDIGGFDEDFFAHQEEIDLCWRAFNLGFNTYVEPQSVIYHVGGATLEASNPKKTFLNFRNSLFMLLKNLPKQKIIPILFGRMVLDGIAALQFILTLKPVHFLAVIKAHFSFYININRMYRKRTLSKKNQYYYALKSIVLNYYVYKKKLFSLLITQ